MHGAKLDLVTELSRSAMRIDVIEIMRRDAGPLQCRLHGSKSAVTAAFRRGDMIGVARHAIADDLGIDLGAAGLGMLQGVSSTTQPAPSPMTNPSRSLS